MRTLLLAALCCSAAHAAVIRGVVLDRSTGRPLARSLVTLRPVEGVGGKPQSVRADRTGQFAFSVSAGMYLLRASRDGFAPFQYGQKEWKSAGKPISVEQDGSLYLDIRLRRYAAISGTVLDENEIGPACRRIARGQLHSVIARFRVRIDEAQIVRGAYGAYRILLHAGLPDPVRPL